MNAVPNSIVLMYVRGWQGGTIYQIARELEVSVQDIVTAKLDRMGELMRIAQRKKWAELEANPPMRWRNAHAIADEHANEVVRIEGEAFAAVARSLPT